jgi:hypothetical protein
MKTYQSIAAACCCALALVGTASAQTKVKVTGSTAFRASVISGIYDVLHANGTVSAAYFNSNAPSTITSKPGNATQVIIQGWTGTPNTVANEIYYQICWSGSYGGTKATATGSDVLPFVVLGDLNGGTTVTPSTTWLATTVTMTAMTGQQTGGTDLSSGGTIASLPSSDYESTGSAPDVSLSDASLADFNAGGFPINASSLTEANNGHDATGQMGVIPFTWVKGLAATVPASYTSPVTGVTVTSAQYAAGYARLTNITWAQAQVLFQQGVMSLAAITGNPADVGIDVLLAGRNNDSGTRYAALSEAFPGGTAGPTAGIEQVDLVVDPSNTESAIVDVGNFDDTTAGYSSGAFVALYALNIAPSSAAIATEPYQQPFIIISYLGVSDSTKGSLGSNELTWNGAGTNSTSSTTQLYNAIENGSYSFWETEYMYYRTGFAGTAGATAMNAVAAKIWSTDATVAGLTLTSIANVSKSGEFVPPTAITP